MPSPIKQFLKFSRGASALPLILMISGVIILIAASTALQSYRENQANLSNIRSAEAFQYAESGYNEALLRIDRDKNLNTSFNLTFDNNKKAEVKVEKNVPIFGQTTITSVGFSYNVQRGLKCVIQIDEVSGLTKTLSCEEILVPSATWACGDPVTFTYKGSIVTYGTVYSPATGKCWMDRNLGASRVATAYNDADAYGDLFQWGRLDDGHQNRNSGTTTTLSSTDVPGHSNFILAPNSPNDWRSPQNDNLWQGVSGTNNPCPPGWRIPTYDEWDAEQASWSQQNYNGAFASPLKLTAGGFRYNDDGSLSGVGRFGYYWSSNIDGEWSYLLYFSERDAVMGSDYRAVGFSVRCIKD